MTCTDWLKGIRRLGRAHYVCAHCGRDVTLELVLLSEVVPEEDLPPVITSPVSNTPQHKEDG